MSGVLPQAPERAAPISQNDSATLTLENGRTVRLWAELLLIFVAAPVAMATVLPGSIMWFALAGIAVVAAILLSLTPGFRWRQLVARAALRIDWPRLGLYVVAAAILSFALTEWLVPGRLLSLPRGNTRLWLVIMVAYPFVSAIPQEIVFRALFFERYGGLFPDLRLAIVANAFVFGLAHLFYGNWPAVVLTAIAGGIFAWAYAHRRSFGYACLLHAVSGQIVFTSGLGIFFYHGAIGEV